MNRINIIALTMLALMIFSACTTKTLDLEHGDILFRGPTPSDLSGAIDKVTQTEKNTHYTHIGIVEKSGDNYYVLHAAPEKGVCKEPLDSFLINGKGKLQTSIYRLKPGYQSHVANAMKSANSLLGQPYDYTYVLESEGFYCSEYIQQIFHTDSVFKLEPMTFKDPATGEFYPTWVEHYKKLGVEIPEGKLGCNPNGMAVSEAIIYIGEL